MDTTAHRIIHQARSMLVDELGGAKIVHRDDDAETIARKRGHGFNVDQVERLDSICSQLMALMLDDPAPPECQTCATPLIQPATGRPRRFCSNACRQADYRDREPEPVWDGLSQRARVLIMNAGLTVTAFVAWHQGDGVWRGDACGGTDDRCIGHHHMDFDSCGCLPVLIEEVLNAGATS